MNPELLLACWGMMTLMVVLPGPDWAYIIAAGLRERSFVPSLGGILVGYLVVVAAVAVGVGAAVAAVPALLVVLTLAAAAYLVWLGVGVLRNPPVAVVPTGAPAEPPASARPWLRVAQGAGVSGLNPKGLLVLVVLLPQFTDASGDWSLPVQLAVLGLIFVASCAIVYSIVGFGARTVLRARPTAMRLVSRVSGAAMVVLAVVLVVEQVSHLASA
ncbi:LysE family translocator [Agromyces allii]|uniref:LysE family transporter n=1 Tax=Agromyces allii TaxID=393607 RepID=A0ABP5CFG1_9MICO|nr:LysE family transporter [Agromyces allii]